MHGLLEPAQGHDPVSRAIDLFLCRSTVQGERRRRDPHLLREERLLEAALDVEVRCPHCGESCARQPPVPGAPGKPPRG